MPLVGRGVRVVGVPHRGGGCQNLERRSGRNLGILATVAWPEPYDLLAKGQVVELGALETKLSASNSSSSTATTTAPVLPITADQQNLLSEAAVEQDARLG